MTRSGRRQAAGPRRLYSRPRRGARAISRSGARQIKSRSGARLDRGAALGAAALGGTGLPRHRRARRRRGCGRRDASTPARCFCGGAPWPMIPISIFCAPRSGSRRRAASRRATKTFSRPRCSVTRALSLRDGRRAGGRRAIFARFGLGKSIMQIELLRLLLKEFGGRAVSSSRPMACIATLYLDACAKLGVEIKKISRVEEFREAEGLYLTNYERVREGKLDPDALRSGRWTRPACCAATAARPFRNFCRSSARRVQAEWRPPRRRRTARRN